MNNIVKAETAPTMSQATTSASVFIALVVILAGLGMAAALQVGSVASAVLAVGSALTALITAPVPLSREFRAPLPCQRGTTEVPRFFFT